MVSRNSSSAGGSTKGNNNNKNNRRWVILLTAVATVLIVLVTKRQGEMGHEMQYETASSSSSPVATSVSNEYDGDEATEQKPIRQISILGERNSGTRWTFDHLSECFGHELTVKKELTRYKHWFQFNDSSLYPHDTLVIAQFRNPYEWLKAMEHVPHHSPAHLRTALPEYSLLNNNSNNKNHSSSADNDWKIFLTKPWTTQRVGTDLWANRTNETMCQQRFLYRDIVSCDLEPLPHHHYKNTIRYSEHQPFYEMRNDGSGLPYDNILELRTDKIRNFLEVATYAGVADVWVVQYEFLVHKGTQSLMDRVAEWTGVEPNCTAKPPQNRQPKKSRRILPDFAKHVRMNLNWTVEEMIGYKPELNREVASVDWR